MSDGFETMVDAAQPFFTKLRANNEKPWFEAHKAQYVNDIRKPAELFADLLAEDISRLTGASFSPKVFRIYRDVRFSKDKSPYNAHLHMLWSAGQPTTPLFFFAIEPDAMWLGLGIFGLSGEMLTRYRRFIDSHGTQLTDLLAGLETTHGTALSDFGPQPLKRVPKPFEQDHPHAELLKRKGLGLGANLPDDWRRTGLVKCVRQMAKAHLPIWHVITDEL